jgi:hypothetical protein
MLFIPAENTSNIYYVVNLIPISNNVFILRIDLKKYSFWAKRQALQPYAPAALYPAGRFLVLIYVGG